MPSWRSQIPGQSSSPGLTPLAWTRTRTSPWSQRRDRRILVDQSRRVALGVGVQGAHGAHLLLASGSLAADDGPDDVWIHVVRPSPASLPQRAEGRPHLGGEDLRLLPGGEVAASIGLVEVGEAGVDRLDPAARRRPDLAGERREADRDGDRRRSLAARQRRGQCSSVLPVRPGRRRCGAGQPVQRDVVEDAVPGEVARPARRRRTRGRSCSSCPCRGRASRPPARRVNPAGRSRSSAAGSPSRGSSRSRPAGTSRPPRPLRVPPRTPWAGDRR